MSKFGLLTPWDMLPGISYLYCWGASSLTQCSTYFKDEWINENVGNEDEK